MKVCTGKQILKFSNVLKLKDLYYFFEIGIAKDNLYPSGSKT